MADMAGVNRLLIEAINYRKAGFATEAEAWKHLDSKTAECIGYTIDSHSIQKTTTEGWEIYFQGHRIVRAAPATSERPSERRQNGE